MKKFFQILTIVLALVAVTQVITSSPEAKADPHSEPGI